MSGYMDADKRRKWRLSFLNGWKWTGDGVKENHRNRTEEEKSMRWVFTYLVVLEFELRALHLLGRHSTTSAMPPNDRNYCLLCLLVFSNIPAVLMWYFYGMSLLNKTKTSQHGTISLWEGTDAIPSTWNSFSPPPPPFWSKSYLPFTNPSKPSSFREFRHPKANVS
jgi:hypothetical protein